jgi:hypothetical protein
MSHTRITLKNLDRCRTICGSSGLAASRRSLNLAAEQIGGLKIRMASSGRAFRLERGSHLRNPDFLSRDGQPG